MKKSPKAIRKDYNIQGCYCGNWETVHTEEARKAALESIAIYRANEKGVSFRLRIERSQTKN